MHTEGTRPMTSLILRRAAIFGTPVALGTLAAIHPMMPEHNLGIWNLIHTLQIPLVALLGISVVLMLRGIEGGIATAARLTIIPWVAFFAAFDGVAGLATGALAGFAHDHPGTGETVDSAVASFGDSLVLAAGLPLGATILSIVVFSCAAISMRRAGISVFAAGALAVGGVVWTFVHPLIGAPAMLVFLGGAFVVETSSRPAAVVAQPVAAEPAR
ncbi:MAG TPA: hypothetical protein VF365_09185, partial [Candidatus Limnocylindria bacterium]